jgi:tetratricopeptide (TPR) repeat protein
MSCCQSAASAIVRGPKVFWVAYMPHRQPRRRCLLRTLGGWCALALLMACLGCRMVSQGRNVDGVRYFQQGQYPVALQRFDAALTIDPQNPDTYYNKAAVYHRMGLANRDQNALLQAESLYNQCLNIRPDHVDCHRGLAVLLCDTGRTDKAFTLLTNWANLSPQNAEARVELARLYEEAGNRAGAETTLNQALALDMRNWRAHAALGRLREQAGDLPQALQNYQVAYSINRNQPDLQRQIAALQARVGPTPGTAVPAATAAAGANRSAGILAPFRRY